MKNNTGSYDQLTKEAVALAGAAMTARGMPQEALPRMEEVLGSTLEQMALCAGIMANPSPLLLEKNPLRRLENLPSNASVGCAGVPGAYAHMACGELFPQGDLHFYEEFPDVFSAVAAGEVEFGVLPVENSSAGAVTEVLSLASAHGLYINASIPIRVRHCLCAHPDTDPEGITTLVSHPQALMQCAGFIRRRGYGQQRFSNTAAAAKKVGEAGPGNLGCICSTKGARLYGLRILQEDIQDFDENYTRFICISRDNILLPGADTISITVAFPNEPGYLNRLLTRFSLCHLDLSKLLSMPIASKDFHVRFFMDFGGSIDDPQVVGLLSSLYEEFEDFRFLGNLRRFTEKGES